MTALSLLAGGLLREGEIAVPGKRGKGLDKEFRVLAIRLAADPERTRTYKQIAEDLGIKPWTYSRMIERAKRRGEFSDFNQIESNWAAIMDLKIKDLKETAHIWDSKKEEKKYFINHYRVTLVYRLRGDLVTIGAVAHQRRRPGYWRDRDF